MEISKLEDPVIQEIREIRDEISEITAGFTDEELLAWYSEQAKKARSRVVPAEKNVSSE